MISLFLRLVFSISIATGSLSPNGSSVFSNGSSLCLRINIWALVRVLCRKCYIRSSNFFFSLFYIIDVLINRIMRFHGMLWSFWVHFSLVDVVSMFSNSLFSQMRYIYLIRLNLTLLSTLRTLIRHNLLWYECQPPSLPRHNFFVSHNLLD